MRMIAHLARWVGSIAPVPAALVAAVAAQVAAASAQTPTPPTMVIVYDGRGGPSPDKKIVDAARDAISRSVHVRGVDVPVLEAACVTREITRTGNDDAKLLTAARTCSKAAGTSAQPIPRLDFVAHLHIDVEVRDLGGILAPVALLRSRVLDVGAGTLICGGRWLSPAAISTSI